MSGRNLYYPIGQAASLRKSESLEASGKSIVFISHKYQDLSMAKKLGKILRKLEINIWLDIKDPVTILAFSIKDKKLLAMSIDRGIRNSTHLLALISPETQGSWWVPYEIGCAHGRKKELVFFIHKKVENVPEYLTTFGRRILDISFALFHPCGVFTL